MTEIFEAEMRVGQKAIDAYSRLSYTMWFALAEFLDNSTQSRLNYEKLIDDVLRHEGRPLTISIIHDRPTKTITVEDNSIGMTRDDLIAALQIANPTQDSKGRSKYGMGMKTAACWIGAKWEVTTCEWASGEEWTATVDVHAIANEGAKVPLTMRRVGKDEHYTRITISDLRRVIQKRSEDTIKTYLGSMYMFDLRPDDDGQVAMKLTYNGEEVSPPQESDWDTDPSGTLMKRDLPELSIDGKTVKGWIGVLRKGGRKYGGFSLFQNGRQIQGFPNAWKPKAIFGGEGGVEMRDEPTYACDHCSVPVELTALVPFLKQHVCRLCYERLHATRPEPDGVGGHRRDASSIRSAEGLRMTPERLEEIREMLADAGDWGGDIEMEQCRPLFWAATELLEAVDELDAGIWADQIADLKAKLGAANAQSASQATELESLNRHIEAVRRKLEEAEYGYEEAE